MELSKHFTLDELLRSDTATRLDITDQFNPTTKVVYNLEQFCIKVLEPLRQQLGQPIHISSGYRCAQLNRIIGGAPGSQHIQGQAADTTAANLTVEEWYQFIKSSGIVFDQLIQEFGRWTHISYNAQGTNRLQCLRAVKENGKTVYKQD